MKTIRCLLLALWLLPSVLHAQGPVRMEIPSIVAGDCILEYTGFTVSYDEKARIPMWVAYELTAEEANGTIGRGGKYFRPDANTSVVQADNIDYRGSGWSRGHMAPAGDFKWDEQAMWDTFLYTNCCPQDERMNNGSWNVLENQVRMWARRFGSVWVVTGPYVFMNKNGRIGPHEIVVPDAFFKAVLTRDVDAWHGIAFLMYNDSQPRRPSESYLTIDELERRTGIDFFPALDDAVEETVEAAAEPDFWRLR